MRWRAQASLLYDWSNPRNYNVSKRQPALVRAELGARAANAVLDDLLARPAAQVEAMRRAVVRAAQRMFYRRAETPADGRDAVDVLLAELARCMPRGDAGFTCAKG